MGRGIICLLTIVCTGCGFILQGREQTVTITTTPSEADIKIPDTLEGKTPVTIDLDRTVAHLLEISKPGYQEKWVVVEKKLSWFIVVANVLTSGPVGPIIDWQLGTWNRLSPSKVEVTLESSGDMGFSTPVELRLTDSSVSPSDATVRVKVYPIEDIDTLRERIESGKAVIAE